MKHLKNSFKLSVVAVVAVFGIGGAAYAATTELSQTINSGTLSVDILDDSQQAVTTPGVSMSAITAATSCQDPGSTGTLGTNTERIYVDNPEAANSGWTLNLAATGGGAATWSNGTDELSYNDATSDGCDTGQLSVDPTVGTVTIDCAGCNLTGVSTGTAGSYENGITDSVNLITADATSVDIWRGYLTDVDLSQVIPAEQPTGTYTLDMTLDVVAS